tara:strand:- start:1510 stop:2646 length:1137 start_codon:yes stop_codon:yes gene_type:complete
MCVKKIVIIFIIFTLLFPKSFCIEKNPIDRDIEEILLNPQFLLFRRGENKKIFEYDQKTRRANAPKYGGVSLNAFEFFESEITLKQEITRNVMRGYLRFLYSDQYIVNEPDSYIKIENLKKVIPVLQFVDGEKNHYLLKRFNDNNFDLIMLEYSQIFEQYSGKKMENFDLLEYLHTARISGVDLLRISIYEENSFRIPRPTNLEIPIKNKSMISILKDNRAAEIEKLNKEKAPLRSMRKIMTTERKAQMIIQPLKDKLRLSEAQRENKFKKRKELVLMRLPHLKNALDATRNEDEITLLVQTEIIRSIYEPDPSESNCPGELKDGICLPSKKWTNKVWKLYRRLYKFKDVASHIFPDRRSLHRQKLSKSKKFGGAELW